MHNLNRILFLFVFSFASYSLAMNPGRSCPIVENLERLADLECNAQNEMLDFKNHIVGLHPCTNQLSMSDWHYFFGTFSKILEIENSAIKKSTLRNFFSTHIFFIRLISRENVQFIFKKLFSELTNWRDVGEIILLSFLPAHNFDLSTWQWLETLVSTKFY